MGCYSEKIPTNCLFALMQYYLSPDTKIKMKCMQTPLSHLVFFKSFKLIRVGILSKSYFSSSGESFDNLIKELDLFGDLKEFEIQIGWNGEQVNILDYLPLTMKALF